jgi:predicted dehydrogenase
MALGKNERLQVAGIGSGGKGWVDLAGTNAHEDAEIVACCDVDSNRLLKATNEYDVPGYADFREMFAELSDSIDAILVSTPDHVHAVAALKAMDLDMHVYCQKPLTWSIWEARQLSLASKKKPHLATQMGTQSASKVHKRQSVKMIQEGGLGAIKAIYGWTDRPTGWWPQGSERLTGEDPIPDTLSWDLWLGPAPVRPFKAGAYHGFKWRGFHDFGCGAIGDMACHIMDTPFYAMDLADPMTVRVDCDDVTEDQFPSKQVVQMTFAGNQFTERDSLPFTWYDGKILPTNEELGMPEGEEIPQNCCAVVGTEGTLIVSTDMWARLFRNRVEVDFDEPDLEGRDHYKFWVDACFGRVKTETHFEFSAKLTEAMLLGAVGSHYPGSTLLWDAEEMRVLNRYSAKQYIKRDYREGFEAKPVQ